MDDFTRKTGIDADEYVRRHSDAPMTLKHLLDALDPLMGDIVALQKADPHALLEGSAMVRLESLARDLRNRGEAFAHTRSTVEGDDAVIKTVRKNAPWLP